MNGWKWHEYFFGEAIVFKISKHYFNTKFTRIENSSGFLCSLRLISEQMNQNAFLSKLAKAECVRFGNFTLKSGMQSPVYVDLRNIISYPEMLQELSVFIAEKINKEYCTAYSTYSTCTTCY